MTKTANVMSSVISSLWIVLARFLTRKQYLKEAEVDEVHVKENFETRMTKNVITHECSSSMRNGKMGASGCQQWMERCSVLTAQSLIKQAQTNSSRCAERMSARLKEAMLIKLATRHS